MPLEVTTHLQRKDASLPVYAVIPGAVLRPWQLGGTTIIEGTANGVDFGRRTIKRWGGDSDDWFIEFTARFCERAELSVGDRVSLSIRRADTSTPDALQRLLDVDQRLLAAWRALSASERRGACEHIRAARRDATRRRRAAAIADKLGRDAD